MRKSLKVFSALTQTSIIAKTTAESTSTAQFAPTRSGGEVTLQVDSSGDALAGVETATIEYSTDGTNWTALKIGGVSQQLSVNTNSITVTGPLVYRVNKTATVGSVGVVVTY